MSGNSDQENVDSIVDMLEMPERSIKDRIKDFSGKE